MARHSKPTWWSRLVPHRWRTQPAPLDCTGPAGPYTESVVRARLHDPAWEQDGPTVNPPRTWVGTAPVVNVPAPPPAGTGVHRANMHSYPT